MALKFAALLVSTAAFTTAAPALWAQPADDARFIEEPTGGVHLPTSGISGEVDAFSTTTNPANLSFQSGWHLGFVLDAGYEDDATSGGRGYGVFLSSIFRGPILNGLGWGFAVEALDPPRVRLDPDPGEPVRFTQSTSLRLGPAAAVGFSWHHFFSSATLGGLDTFDIGLSARIGAHLAFGAVIRDIGAPTVEGTPVQRRYEAEISGRPFGTDRLELAIGGRVGETRTDVDGWLRGSLRVVNGVFLRAAAENRELHVFESTASGNMVSDQREYRVTGGLEISFGGLGIAGYGTTALDETGDGRFSSGSVTMRISEAEIPSVIPPRKRLEPLELGGRVGQRSLTRLIGYMRYLERDDDVVGVLLKLDGFSAGWANAREIRRQVLKLRAKGKRVYAHMVEGSTVSYYVASAADKVYIDPGGMLRLEGFSATSLYFKGVFDKLGVEAEFEKIEEYKSAPEQYTRAGPTRAAYEQRTSLYDSIYATVVGDIAKDRKLSPEAVKTLINEGPYTAGDLEKKSEIIDAVALPDDVSKLIEEDVAKAAGVRVRFGRARRARAERWSYPKIAIIYIVGDIVGGKSQTIPILGRSLVGGDTIRAAIARARADRSVKAIILRISSPGGSALASEIMAREVFKTREKKPIICSLGNVAASGGYFAAAGCDYIFAEPTTITGSIGIFNGKFDVSGLLTRLGVSWTTYKRGDNSDALSFYRPFTPKERATLKEKLRYFYGRFTGAVAEGRGMTKEQVDSVGRGHVWTGEQALPIKLIDELGGISEAIDMAKKRAGFGDGDRVTLLSLPKSQKSLISQLVGGNIPGLRLLADDDSAPRFYDEPAAKTGDAAWLNLLPGNVGETLRDAIPASLWHQPQSTQARLPFAIRWH